MTPPRTDRWRGRPVLAAGLRIFVILAPIGAAVMASALLSQALGRAHNRGQLAEHLAVIFSASTIVLFGADRLARRLLPLAVLLKLSLAFPDEAPSRMRVARRAASTRDLEARVERARRDGFEDEPARAAEHILSLIAAVEAHDRATRGHSERVRVFTDMVAEQLKLGDHAKDRLRWAAMLHDVGKLRVPARVLNKPEKLDKLEWSQIQRHPDEGARLVAPLNEWLGEWAATIEQHHERYDGTGYPRGLAGDQISYGGRIVALTDAYETMTAARPYRKPLSGGKARAELVACSGTHFDPTIVRAFLQISVRRLGLVSGPVSWLAQTPFLRGIEQVAVSAGRAASSAAAGVGAVAMAVSPMLPGTANAGTAGGPSRSVVAALHAPADDGYPSPSAPEPQPNPTPTWPVTPSPTPEPKPTYSPPPTTIGPSPRPSPTPSGVRWPRPTPSPSPSGDPHGLPLPPILDPRQNKQQF